MTKILLLADEAQLLGVGSRFNEAGFELLQATCAEDALARLPHADAVVLDLLYIAEGNQLCRQIRGISNSPILGLTDMMAEGEVDDGLVEVDDFVIKPVSAAELVARLRVLLRRAGRGSLGNRLLHVRDLTIDQERLQVVRGGRPVSLTPTQFRLLACLARNAGRVMTSQELLKEAQGYECDEQEAQEIVKVHINHLRQKIEPGQATPTYIVNVRGFGYMLERRGSTHRTSL